MKAFVFPGQGSQFSGMGKTLWDESDRIKELFEEANQVLGFSISDIMFYGSEEELKQTRVTQPAIFLHSIAASLIFESMPPDFVAGHSLGEFSALVVAKAISFKEGLKLVSVRAEAMQKACEINPSTMAAILGLDDEIVIEICHETQGIVVPANFNSPGQIIISGEFKAVEEACLKCKEAGAKRTLPLSVGGAFHSPLMEPAKEEFEKYIDEVEFQRPLCPIVQNVDAKAHISPKDIKENLKAQLTAPVRWTGSVEEMIRLGVDSFVELGPGKVLKGLINKIDRNILVENH